MSSGTGLPIRVRLMKAVETLGEDRFRLGFHHVALFHAHPCPRVWSPLPCCCAPQIIIHLPPHIYEVDAYGFPVRLIGKVRRGVSC